MTYTFRRARLCRHAWPVVFLSLARAAVAADPQVAGTLEEVRVTGEVVQEGGAASGYRADTVRMLGPWGEQNLQDTPSSITVLSSELIENVTAGNVDQLFKVAPLVQAGQPHDVNGIAQVTVRGFNVARVYADGVPNNSLGLGVFVEEMDRMEILSGLSGFLYGASPVGGLVNYQLKRPTDTNLRRLTLGNYGGSQYYVHADLGGRVGDTGAFGYRLNVLKQDGDTAIDHQSVGREMFSGQFDWRITQRLSLQFGLSSKRYRLDGRPFQFYLGTSVPDPLDGSKLYAPSNTFVDIDTGEANVGLTYRISENLSIRTAYQRKKDERSMAYGIGNLLSPTQYQMNLFGSRHDMLNEGGYAYLDSSFLTGSVRHRVTMGFNGYSHKGRLAVFAHGTPFFFDGPHTVDFASPNAGGVTVPAWDLRNARMSHNATLRHLNTIIGDDVQINDRWTLKLGANRSRITSESFDPVGGGAIAGSLYNKTATTPTLSVLYRPSDGVTAYASYIESLEPGAIVGTTYQNAGEILEPLMSRQLELGLKGTVGGVHLAGTLFEIDKANEHADDGTPTGRYVQDGRQVHRGLELSATGKPMKEWTVIAGLVLMGTQIARTNDPLLAGKKPTWVSERSFKVYTEYGPVALPGWTFTGGVYFVGGSFQDAMNTQRVPGYHLFDLGLRYRTKLMGADTVMRLNLMNVTNERYWAASSPGLPRALAFSMSTAF